MDCSMPGLPVQLLEFSQTHVHWVGDATQPSHPLSFPFSSCPQSFPASGSFPMSQLFASGGQSIEASSVLPKNLKVLCLVIHWWFWTVELEKTLKSSLDCKEIQPVHPKGNQSWVFFGRTDVETETPILWPPDAKNWLIWKDPDAGKDWGQEKRMTKDEMVGWHHRLNGYEFEQVPGIGDGQGGLACCSPWGCKESDTTEWLN